MKKILLVVMLFASVLFLNACGSKKSPMISNPDGDYLTVKEGSNTYTVKNRRVYEVLRDQVGYSILMDLIDTDLLKNTKKDGVSYWDQVSQTEIDERLEKDIFPNGKDELTDEEIAEKREKHLDSLFSEYGLMTEADVFNYYKLLIAKEKYADVKMREQVAEKDFTETDYKNYFNNNFKDEYYAIVVKFDSYKLLDNALKQLGYSFKDSNLVKSDGSVLTKDQVAKAFIELFNMVNASNVENYPTNTLTLNEGTQYNIVEGKLSFDLEEIDSLHYTHNEITKIESSIQKMLASFDKYSEGENFYTKSPQVFNSGAMYTLFMKIDQVKYDLEAKKPEIKEALIKQRMTTNFINIEMIKLRHENNIELYQEEFADNFVDQAGQANLKYTITDKRDGFLVAKTDFKEYNADELFSAMNKNYGISSAISELEFNRFLDNPEINKIYNFNTKEAIDPTRWTVIQQSIKDEKANFEKDMYKDNGFPASIGWDKFIKDVYGANSEAELERFFVFQDVKDRYAKSFGDLEGATLEGERWTFYKNEMDKMVAEYFNVTGVHLLITINDANGNPIDPKEWNETQVEYAKEFYEQIMEYLNDATITDTATKKLENVQNAYNRAPYFVAGVSSESQPVIEGLNYVFNGIEVSKFKSAGLIALYQDLGSFTNGNMVKEFNDAAKSIWDADSDSSETVIYDSTPDTEGNYEYLVTQFGYHVYVNTKTTPIVEYSTGNVLPSIADAKEFLKDNNSSSLSSKLKTSLETYFKPVYTELTSTNKIQIVSYRAISELEFTLHHDDYKVEDLQRFLSLTITNKEANLKYN